MFLISAQSFVSDGAVYQSKQRVVFTDTYARAGMNLRASLTNENVASKNELTVSALYAKAFRFAVTSVVRRTGTFFMSE